MENKRMIISIGRECGSGGHEIGERLAEHYGIAFYDKNFLSLLGAETGQDPEKLAEKEEKVKGLFSLFAKKGGYVQKEDELMRKFTKSDLLFEQEKGLILDLAKRESFVIIGRAANAILKDDPNTFKLYVYAPEQFRIPRVKAFYGLDTDQEAREKMQRVDKMRRVYFDYYTDYGWGTSDAHDFMIDTSVFGIDETVQILISLIDKKFG